MRDVIKAIWELSLSKMVETSNAKFEPTQLLEEKEVFVMIKLGKTQNKYSFLLNEMVW